jgi:hypothetical protein
MANPLLKALATKINAAVDVPVVPEFVEQAVIELALETGLGFLPPQYVAWIQSAADGIDDTEAADLTAWLSDLMGKYGTAFPAFLHGYVASAIVSMLRRGAAVVIE